MSYQANFRIPFQSYLSMLDVGIAKVANSEFPRVSMGLDTTNSIIFKTNFSRFSRQGGGPKTQDFFKYQGRFKDIPG